MTVQTIQRAFLQRKPKEIKLKESNELDPSFQSFFAPTNMVAKGEERTTHPSWVEKVIEFFSTVFGHPTRAEKRASEVMQVISDIKENYFQNKTILHDHDGYRIKKNKSGEIILSYYVHDARPAYDTQYRQSSIHYNSPLTPMVGGHHNIRKVEIVLVSDERISEFLTVHQIKN